MVEGDTTASGRNAGRLAGIGLAAAGASAAAAYLGFTAFRRRRTKDDASLDPEFQTGRGERRGPVDPKSRAAGYELEDTDVRKLVMVMAVSIGIMIVGVASVFFMYSAFDRHFIAESNVDTAQQRQVIEPPLPHLQADPYRDIDAATMEQRQRLSTFGYAAPDEHGAHIPIEHAMQQIVGKPLDASAAADASGAPGTKAPFPTLPAYNAALPQAKPANQVQGEGRPGAVAPSYRPRSTTQEPKR